MPKKFVKSLVNTLKSFTLSNRIKNLEEYFADENQGWRIIMFLELFLILK